MDHIRKSAKLIHTLEWLVGEDRSMLDTGTIPEKKLREVVDLLEELAQGATKYKKEKEKKDIGAPKSNDSTRPSQPPAAILPPQHHDNHEQAEIIGENVEHEPSHDDLYALRSPKSITDEVVILKSVKDGDLEDENHKISLIHMPDHHLLTRNSPILRNLFEKPDGTALWDSSCPQHHDYDRSSIRHLYLMELKRKINCPRKGVNHPLRVPGPLNRHNEIDDIFAAFKVWTTYLMSSGRDLELVSAGQQTIVLKICEWLEIDVGNTRFRAEVAGYVFPGKRKVDEITGSEK